MSKKFRNGSADNFMLLMAYIEVSNGWDRAEDQKQPYSNTVAQGLDTEIGLSISMEL
jgi:hypothetical protein